MPDKLQLGPGPDAPKKDKAAAPTLESISTSYRDVSGIAGSKRQNHILQSDSESSPGIALQTVGDMYLNADAHMQLFSKTCTHNVDDKLLQYYKEVERNISANQKEIVDGSNTLTVNTDYNLTVVGLLLENINLHDMTCQDQHITIAGEQVETIHGLQYVRVGADQKLEVGGNQDVEVKGNYVHHAVGTSKITSDGDWEGFKKGCKNDVVLGNNFKATIGGREEAKIGFCEDLKVAGCMEQVFAINRKISHGPVITNNKTVSMTTTEAYQKAKVGVASMVFKVYLASAEINQEECKMGKTKASMYIFQ